MAQTLESAVEEFNSEHRGEGISAYIVSDEIGTDIVIDIDGHDSIYVKSVEELNSESAHINRLQDQLER